MNPDSEKYDRTWIESVLKAANKYHSSPSLYVDEYTYTNTVMDLPEAKKPDTPAPAPVSTPTRLESLKALQVSGASEEEINDMIDYLHEVLLTKRHESLLDLEPGLE